MHKRTGAYREKDVPLDRTWLSDAIHTAGVLDVDRAGYEKRHPDWNDASGSLPPRLSSAGAPEGTKSPLEVQAEQAAARVRAGPLFHALKYRSGGLF